MAILIIFIQIFLCISSQDRLVFVYTHFRHGARGPTELNDNYKDLLEESWENTGELTGVGERMHYLLGFRNRIRYIKNQTFLSEKYDPHEILIYSSDSNRTLVSCSSHLQGLYPQRDLNGKKLSDSQINLANPQVDMDYEEINQEKKNLGNYALPYSMILAPIRTIKDDEKKFHLHKIKGCGELRDKITKQNKENIIYLNETIETFNEKYGERLNKFYNESKKYSYSNVNDFCSNVLTAYADSRELTQFKKLGFDLDEINDFCWEYHKNKYLYEMNGDDDKIWAHIDSSLMMKEVMYYMKRRLDADITEENEDDDIRDYSRPRMIIFSGHDTSLSSNEIFILYALGLNINENYLTPKFASQLALEVKAKNNQKTSKYSDYYVSGYFDKKEIFNLSADEFIDKIEKEIWSEDKIDEYCGLNKNESNESYNNSTKSYRKDKAKTAYKVLMIVFICLSTILLISTIFLGYKLYKLTNISRKPNSNNNENVVESTTHENFKV